MLLKFLRRCPMRCTAVFICVSLTVSMAYLKAVTTIFTLADTEAGDDASRDRTRQAPREDFSQGSGPQVVDDRLSEQLVRDERKEKLLNKERHLARMHRRVIISELPGFDGNFQDIENLGPGPYLQNYANPCWYEQYPPAIPNLYGNHCILAPPASGAFNLLSPDQLANARHKFEIQQAEIMSKGRTWRLQCLPKVFLVGVDKGGAFQLAGALKDHPLLDNGHFRESDVTFWTHMRQTCEASLLDYADLYDRTAEKIRGALLPITSKNANTLPFHPGLALDDTTLTYRQHICTGEVLDGICQGQTMSVAHVIKKVIPEAKVVVIVRDPVERAYKSYLTRADGEGASFHIDTIAFLDKFERCVESYGTELCELGQGADFTKKKKVPTATLR